MRNFLFGMSVMTNVVEALMIYILFKDLKKADPTWGKEEQS